LSDVLSTIEVEELTSLKLPLILSMLADDVDKVCVFSLSLFFSFSMYSHNNNYIKTCLIECCETIVSNVEDGNDCGEAIVEGIIDCVFSAFALLKK
jgi:hypothetical protein